MRFIRSAMLAACAACLSLSASAAPLTVAVKTANTGLAITLPEGYCPLDEARPGHRKLLDLSRARMENSNDILLLAALCGDATLLADGKIDALHQSYIVLAPTQAKGLDLTGQEAKSLAGVCSDLRRAAGGGSAEPDLFRLEAQVAAILSNLKPGDLVPMGLYIEEPGTFCLNGFALKQPGKDGAALPSVILSGMVVWHGVLVQVLHTIVYEKDVRLAADTNGFEEGLVANLKANSAAQP